MSQENDKNLDQLRQSIQAIDDQVLELFSRRMDLAREVYQVKKEIISSIYNPETEERKIRLAQESEDPNIKEYGASVLRTLMRVSRSRQYALARPDSMDWEIGTMLTRQKDLQYPVQLVATQGNAYSYSAKAATILFPGRAYYPHRTFEEAILSVVRGQVDAAVLPLENSTAGTVDDVYQLLQNTNLYITRSLNMTVKHCLLVKPGTKLSDIKTVSSHKQALAQCSSFIKDHNWEVVESLNTAFAAQDVAEGDGTMAAIATSDAAEAYGLTILEENFSDANQNETRFVVVRRHLQVDKEADTLSLLVRLPHSAGSLVQVMDLFADHGINMTKIQSIPIPRNPWEYYFYIDCEANFGDETILNVLYQLQHESTELRLLGWYKQVSSEEGKAKPKMSLS